MELAVANLIGYRKFTIVPNVSHGLYLNHECDLLVLDDQNRFTEVEIKISLADMKKDLTKPHGHKSKYISRLIYAVPDKILDKCLPYIPNHAGIIIVKEYEHGCIARWHRQARHDKTKNPVPKDIINKFYQLGCMRIWSLKAHNNKNGNK